MVKTTTAPGRAAEQSKAGPGTRKMLIPLVVAGTGADGEKSVREVLESLPEGYFVVHDFDSGKGMIGRILIGPKGIFTLETKSHTGEVTFDGNQLLRNGRPLGKDLIRRAWAQCFLVRGLLAEYGVTPPLPEPVILFADAHA